MLSFFASGLESLDSLKIFASGIPNYHGTHRTKVEDQYRNPLTLSTHISLYHYLSLYIYIYICIYIVICVYVYVYV